MNSPDLILRSRRLVLEDKVTPGALHIGQGKILKVCGYEDILRGSPVIDMGNLAIMPGLVDTMVHINEPGREHWEGFASATLAAAAGGVTTLVDMPAHASPATITVEALSDKIRAAKANDLYVDVGFWGGLVPGNIQDLKPMWHAGVLGFACTMHVDHPEDFSPVSEHTLREAYPHLARIQAPLTVRCEDPYQLKIAQRHWSNAQATEHSAHLLTHPDEAELEATALIAQLCAEYRVKTHISPISSAQSLALLRQAQKRKLPLSAATSAHHLFFHTGHIRRGQTLFKCAPPIRDEDNQAKLWEAVLEGLIDTICSDHDPSSPEFKALEVGDFESARGGIGAMQWLLPAFWSRAKLHGVTLPELAQRVCAAPAKHVGLGLRKGKIAPGYDADLVIFNPEASFIARAQDLKHKHKQTPYEGWILQGVVEATYLRGQCVFRRQNPSQSTPTGQLLLARDSPSSPTP